ncbi:stage III sporulation protein AB [Gracilibacillus halotolerans]|uniref:Stage III sporulation protein AB n=1 Tax=Gracilibacillus halotolerans TaxID=74386 RepID=A0A841RIB3_9BACI|nr:stage III sporulation protein SpoIIIAB [Gracilibacillus halotolerans]MBB6511762.1 stage III sporulation protein AB [Gracilibacillus halotolerans]
MKVIAILMIIAACSVVGFEISNGFARRTKNLRLWKDALRILEAEIVYSQTPIIQVFQKLSKQLPKPMKELFAQLAKEVADERGDLYEIWSEKLEDFSKISHLKTEDVEILKQFGRTLGKYDILQHEKQIQLTLTHLDRKAAEANEQNAKFGKMSRALGVLSGIFIALLLL